MAERPMGSSKKVREKEMKSICPVCGKAEVKYFYDCPVCGWSNDPVQADHDDWLGENNITLAEAKRLYKKYGTVEPSEEKTA